MYKITASPYIILDHPILYLKYMHACITSLICFAFIFKLHFYAEKIQDWPKVTHSSFWGKILCRAFLHKRRNVFTKREHQTPFSKGKQSTISGSRKGISSKKEFLTSLYSCQIYHVMSCWYSAYLEAKCVFWERIAIIRSLLRAGCAIMQLDWSVRSVPDSSKNCIPSHNQLSAFALYCYAFTLKCIICNWMS